MRIMGNRVWIGLAVLFVMVVCSMADACTIMVIVEGQHVAKSEDENDYLPLSFIVLGTEEGTISLASSSTGGEVEFLDKDYKTITSLSVAKRYENYWVKGIKTSTSVLDVTVTATLKDAGGNPLDTATDMVTVFEMQEIKRDVAGGGVDYQPITDANRNVLPGQKMNLRVQVTPAIGGTEWEWTLPGVTFKNYTAKQTEGVLTRMYSEDRDEKDAVFYWADTGDSRTVSCAVVIPGLNAINKTASFNVKKPTCTYSRAIGDAGINATKTRIGLYPAGGTTKGIDYTAKVEMPAGFAQGKWNYLQVLIPKRKRTKNDNVVEYVGPYGKNCLDTTYPYYPPPYSTHPGTAGSWTTGATTQTRGDTPTTGLQATGYKHKDVDKEEFRTYVMFLPPGEETRYVPLKKVYWWWEASATKGATEWSLDAGSDNQNADAPTETSVHSTWVRNIVTDGSSYYAKGSVTITLPEDVIEGGGTAQATVSVMANVTSNLTVNLTSSDTSEITVPATVTITTGNKSVNFNITIVNDATKDGTQTTFVTATATGYANGKGAVAVRDNE